MSVYPCERSNVGQHTHTSQMLCVCSNPNINHIDLASLRQSLLHLELVAEAALQPVAQACVVHEMMTV